MKILIVLILIVILKKLKNEGDDETGDDKWLERKIANPLRRAEPIRVMRLAFMFSFATSPGGVKGTKFVSSIRGGVLAVFAPGRAVFDDPIRQRLLETDIAPGLFRLDPFMT
jgi:hypothetical protein